MTQEVAGMASFCEGESQTRWREKVLKLAKHYELEPEEIEAIYAQLKAESQRG